MSKLSGAAMIGSVLANRVQLHRFLACLAGVVVLAIATAFMFCVLAVGGLYAVYLGLINYGVDPTTAGTAVAIFVVLITLCLILITMLQFRKLRDTSHYSMPTAHTALPDLPSMADAFVDGFLNGKPHR